MKLYPIEECIAACRNIVEAGGEVHQEWTCAGCGSEQVMPDINTFHNFGKCEACGRITNIKTKGCNYLVIFERPKQSQA